MKNRLLLFIMKSLKFSTYLLVIHAFYITSVMASTANAQFKSVKEVKIKVNFNDASVEEIFKTIEKETDFEFHFLKRDLNDQVKFKLSESEITVADLLYKISDQAALKFRQVNNNIAVSVRRRAEEVLRIIEDIRVSGQVTDDEGEGLPGVTVLVKGTSTGVITDIDGNYTIEVPEDGTLVFSFVGFETQEIAVLNRTTIDVSMGGATELDEVVVIAFGEMDKRKFVGSAEFVGSEKIESVPVASFDNILQGQAPGLQIVPASGQPGGATNVRIRGVGSISSGNSPLYVIDGVILNNGNDTQLAQTGNVLSTINPNDIESISILKDASAAALYGSQAGNGVILITTKRGKAGKPRYTFRAQRGVSDWENAADYGVMNSSEYLEYHREAVLNAGGNPDEEFLTGGNRNPGYFPVGSDSTDTDWFGAAFDESAITEQYELSVSGGSSDTRYFINGSYFFQEGLAIDTDLERISSRINLDHDTEKVNFGLNMSISRSIIHNRYGGGTSFGDPIYGGHYISPLRSPFATSEQIASGEDRGTGFNFDLPELGGHNSLATLALNSNELRRLRFIGNVFAETEIVTNLRLRGSFGVDWVKNDEDEFTSRNHQDGLNTNGDVNSASREILTSTSNVTLRYDFSINDEHNFSVLGGSEYIQGDDSEVSFSSQQIASDKLKLIGNAADPNFVGSDYGGYAVWGLFSRLNYDYQGKYFAEASFRRDGSSRFGIDTRYGNFWAVGGGYTLSEEAFMQGIEQINNLKLRASYGVSGNQSFGDFQWRANYLFDEPYNTVGGIYPGSRAARIANPGLGWEENKSFNVGATISLFQDRVNLEVDRYNRVTSDLLLNQPISRTSGFNTVPRNVGEVENKGWEVNLTTNNIIAGDFSWTTNVNFTTVNNEVLTLPSDSIIDPGGDEQRIIIGQELGVWFLPEWAGVNPATGEPLWYDEDNNVTSNYSDAEFRVAGQSLPDFYGSFINTFAYKGLSLSVFFYFNYGNDIYREINRFTVSDGSRFGRNQLTEALDRWQQPGDVTDVPRAVQGNNDGGNNHSTRYLEDGSFIKLRNVTLAYQIPAKFLTKLKLEGVRVYAQGQNLQTWTEYRGMDPENGISGNSFGEYPVPRTITLGVDVNF